MVHQHIYQYEKTKCLDSLLRLSRHFLLSFNSRKMSCMLDIPDFTDLDEIVLTAPKITGYLWNKQRYGGTWNNDIVRARAVLKSCWFVCLSAVCFRHVITKYPQKSFTTYEKIIICEIFALFKACKKISHSIKTRWKISIIFSCLKSISSDLCLMEHTDRYPVFHSSKFGRDHSVLLCLLAYFSAVYQW